jgi:hypothetical protein
MVWLELTLPIWLGVWFKVRFKVRLELKLPVWLRVWFIVWFIVPLELLFGFTRCLVFDFGMDMFGAGIIGSDAFMFGPEMLDLAGPSTCCSGFDLGVGIFIGTIKSGEGVTQESSGP